MKRWWIILIMYIIAAGCKKTFVPPDALNNTNKYLVIDGVINAGSDSTFIKLSRTKNLRTVLLSIMKRAHS